MVKCVTKSGFICELDENLLNNMELIDVLADDTMDMGFRASKAVKLILGAENRKQLYDHLRAPDGRVPVEAVNAALEDIFESFGQSGKNS